jgi:hypothetical protein
VRGCALRWGPPRQTLLDRIFHNPIYAGAYVYGRHEQRMGLVDGQVRRQCTRRIPQEAWPICLRDHHPAYMSWDEFMANQQKLHENRRGAAGAVDQRGAARDGEALLQGLVLCGRCGRRMETLYCGNERRPVYQCCQLPGGAFCWSVPARAIDRAVAGLFLDCITPPEIELALAVVREANVRGARSIGNGRCGWSGPGTTRSWRNGATRPSTPTTGSWRAPWNASGTTR